MIHAAMSKIIPLTKGKFTIVDDEDFEDVKRFKWQAIPMKTCWYASRGCTKNGVKTRILMHVHLLGKKDGMVIDHRDNSGLNNQRHNLRFCTHPQNHYNSRMQWNNTSGCKGVSWDPQRSRWQVFINADGKRIQLGRRKTFDEAVQLRTEAVQRLHGEFARAA